MVNVWAVFTSNISAVVSLMLFKIQFESYFNYSSLYKLILTHKCNLVSLSLYGHSNGFTKRLQVCKLISWFRHLDETTIRVTGLDLRCEDYESKRNKSLEANPCCHPSHQCFIDTSTNWGLTAKWSHQGGRPKFLGVKMKQWNFLHQYMTCTWTRSSCPERTALWSGASWLRSRRDVSASDSKSSWMILTWRPRMALCNGVLPELSKAFTSKTGETYRRFTERKIKEQESH